jgi:integrase/recombinase XerC
MNAKDWIAKYEDYLTLVKNRSNHTVRGYLKDLELLQVYAMVENWSELTEDVATEYVRHLKKIEQRDTTIARKIYCFRGFFKFLRRNGVQMPDPFEDMEFRNLHKPLPRFLTIDEMNKLLTCIRQPLPAFYGIPGAEVFMTVRDKSMLEVLYSCALRVSELVGLNWEDIDLAKREVRVLGKGKKERQCPLGRYALEALLEYAPHYERQWERRAEGPAPAFLSNWNMRINQRTIPRMIRKWCRLAGVKVIHPHGFRHSAATHMLDGGADIRVIQRLLGHSSLVTTEIYTTVATKKVKTTHAQTHPWA